MGDFVSGKDGTVKTGGTPTEVANVMSWSIEAGPEITASATNSTAGWKQRVAGTKDATGKIKIRQVDDSAPGLVPGTIYEAVLDIDGADTNKYTGSIMIEKFTGYEVDINDGKAIDATYDWGAHGELTAAGNAPAI